MSQTKVYPATGAPKIVLKSVSKQSSIQSAWSDLANTSTSDYIAVAVVTTGKDDYVTIAIIQRVQAAARLWLSAMVISNPTSPTSSGTH